MGRSTRLRTSDARALLQTVAELADIPQSGNRRLAHLLTRMKSLFNARVVSAGAAELKDHDTVRCLSVFSDGWEEADRKTIRSMLYHSRGSQLPLAPYLAKKIRERTEPFCIFDRRVMFDDHAWYRSSHTMEYCRSLDVDENLYSLSLIPGTWQSAGFGMSRPWGERRPFGARERQMLELLLHATVKLITPIQPKLPPRQKQVLGLILAGIPIKQIAAELHLSIHTVDEHLGTLYRKFNVTGRTELAAKFAR